MKWKMLFRVGLTVVVLVAIILFYINNVLHGNSKDRISELVKSDSLAFEEAVIHHGKGEGRLEPVDENKIKADGIQVQSADAGDRGQNHSPEQGGVDNEVNTNLSDENSEEEDTDHLKNEGNAELKFDSEHGDGEVHEKGERGAVGLAPLHHSVGKLVYSQVHQIHLAVVACGDRAEEVIVMLKSAVILTTSTPLIFHIFAEADLHTFFTEQLLQWPPEILDRVEYRVYDITFPAEENAEDWKKLFKPCATQRLFLPSLLTGVDSLLYIDTDILFLSPLHKIWAFFKQFNATQLAALAPEHEDPNVGWYNRFARHPYVPPLGVNSGVMLMNLTRLRQSSWLSSMLRYYKEYRLKITWGDQDLINIYFHDHPDELFMYSCEWNYRADHCMYMSVCKTAEKHGAFVLHGSRRVMHNDKQPAFRAVYSAFKNYQFGQHLHSVLLESIRQNLDGTKSTPCGKVSHIFLTQVEQFVTEVHEPQLDTRKKTPGSNGR